MFFLCASVFPRSRFFWQPHNLFHSDALLELVSTLHDLNVVKQLQACSGAGAAVKQNALIYWQYFCHIRSEQLSLPSSWNCDNFGYSAVYFVTFNNQAFRLNWALFRSHGCGSVQAKLVQHKIIYMLYSFHLQPGCFILVSSWNWDFSLYWAFYYLLITRLKLFYRTDLSSFYVRVIVLKPWWSKTYNRTKCACSSSYHSFTISRWVLGPKTALF